MIKNVTPLLYSAPAAIDMVRLDGELAKAKFVPCSGQEKERAGWVEHQDASYVRKVGDFQVMQLMVEKKAVPAAVLKEAVKESVERYRQMSGQEPKGKDLRDLKDEALARLLPRAFPKRNLISVWFNPNSKLQLVYVGSTSASCVDVTLKLLNRVGMLGTLNHINTEVSPSTLMGEWLVGEPFGNFTVDDACELVLPVDGKPTVKYSRHTLAGRDIRDHLQEGKVPASLALTHADNLSFVLTGSWMLKSIHAIDNSDNFDYEQEEDAQGAADATFLLEAEATGSAIESLVSAMGGLAAHELSAAAGEALSS